MSAYLIVDVTEIGDERTYAAYRSRVATGIQQAGGRYLARGGAIEVLEGDWRPHRIVVVSFDSPAAARAWWASTEYADLKRMRMASTKTNMIVVDGVPAPGVT